MALTHPMPQERVPTQDVDVLYRIGAVLTILSGLLSGITPLGELLFVSTFGLALLALLIRKRVDVFVVWPTLFLVSLAASGLLLDSLPSTRSLRGFTARLPDFVAGEGRVFLAYAPLLLAAVCRPRDRSIGFVVRLFRIVAWVGVFMITVGQLPPLRSTFYSRGTDHLFGLSSSHHVSGFLFGTAALVLLTTHRGDRRSNLWLGLAMLGAVVLTGSRTTLVGIAIAAVVALAFRSTSQLSARWLRRFRVATVIGIALLIPLQSTLNVPILQPEVLSSGFDNLSERDPKLGTGAYDPRTANSLKRIALWGEGLDAFASSPLVGIGAFRFNDEVTGTIGPEGFVQLAYEGRRNHSVATAHNAYVHTAAELGIVGLAMLLAIWVGLLLRLHRQRRVPWASDAIRSDAESAMLVVVFAFGTGLTSSSLFTPGLCIPVLLYVGAIAMRRDAATSTTAEPVLEA